MSAAYQHLALAEVEPGMVLSDDIVDQQGQVLLPRGAVLSAATIALLPGHGIDMLAVLRTDAEPAAAQPDSEAIERRLAHLFRNNALEDSEDWATGMLRRYMGDYRRARGDAA